MSLKFGRPFQYLNRLFPGSQYQPGEVSETVQPVFDLMTPSIVHAGVRFVYDSQSAATGGVDTTLRHTECGAGMVWLPLAWWVIYDGPTNIRVALAFTTTGASSPDLWGRYAAAPIDYVSMHTGNNIGVAVPGIPLMRGMRYEATFLSPGPATNVISRIVAIEAPMELVKLEHWRSLFGNMVNTRALP